MTTMQRPMPNDTKRALLAFFTVLALWLTFFYALIARAEDVVTSTTTPAGDELARALFEALSTGKWWPAAALALSLAVWAVRKWPFFLPAKVQAFITSDRGGVILTVASAVLAGVVNALLAGVPFGFAWVETVGKVALTSIGGYVGLKKLIFPSDAKPAPAPAPEA